MKIYELMNILKDLPAGMEVRACDPLDTKPSYDINDYESDGHVAEGCLTLYFSQNKHD